MRVSEISVIYIYIYKRIDIYITFFSLSYLLFSKVSISIKGSSTSLVVLAEELTNTSLFG